eukprot:11827860-Ditylum_brightwellii.AAC.1
MHDNWGKFVGFKFQELLVSYGIKLMPMTVPNPQSNSPIEQMYLVMEGILRTKVFEGNDWEFGLNHTLQALA